MKNPGSRPRRPRKPVVKEEDEENEQEPVELETSRSGRVRKKPKFRCVNHRQYAQPLLADFLYDFVQYFLKIPSVKFV